MRGAALQIHTRQRWTTNSPRVYARGVQPRSARLGPDPADQVDLAEQLVAAEERGEIVEWPAPVQTLPTPQPVRAKREFAGRRIEDLSDEMASFVEEAGDDADWDYFDRLTAEIERREAVNLANRARRQAAKEARETAQGAEYERLLAQGMDDESAIELAYGVSVQEQRRINAMSTLRGMGYSGKVSMTCCDSITPTRCIRRGQRRRKPHGAHARQQTHREGHEVGGSVDDERSHSPQICERRTERMVGHARAADVR